MRLLQKHSVKVCSIVLVIAYISSQISIEVTLGNGVLRLAFADVYLPLLCFFCVVIFRKLDLSDLKIPILLFLGIIGIFVASTLSVKVDLVSWAGVKSVGLLIIGAYMVSAYICMRQIVEIDRADEKFITMTSKAFVLALLLGVVYFFYVKANYWAYNFLNVSHPQRLSGFIRNPNAYGLYIACFCLLFWSYLVDKKERSLTKWAIILLIILALILTGSRGAMLASVSGLVLFFCFHPREIPQGFTLVGLASLIPILMIYMSKAFIWIVQWFGSVYGEAKTSDLQETLRQLQPDYLNQSILVEGADSGAVERLESYKSALSLWLDNPVFGAGLGYFRENAPQFGFEYGHVIHNTGLWLLAETGLVGFMIVAVLFIYLFKTFWECRDNWFCQGMCAVLIVAAVMSQTSEILYQRHLWILIGIGLAVAKFHQEKKKAKLV